MVIPRPGSELKAGEKACREASRTVEPIERLEPLEQVFRPWKTLLTHDRSTLQRKSSMSLFLRLSSPLKHQSTRHTGAHRVAVRCWCSRLERFERASVFVGAWHRFS